MKRSLAPSQRPGLLSTPLRPKFTPVQPKVPCQNEEPMQRACEELKTQDFATKCNSSTVCSSSSSSAKMFSLPRTALRCLDRNVATTQSGAPQNSGGHSKADGVNLQPESAETPNPPPTAALTPQHAPPSVRQPLQLKPKAVSSASLSGTQQSESAPSLGKEEPDLVYWEVYWTKQSRKKHKTYSDGVLVLKGNSAQLVKEDGEMASKTTIRGGGSLQPGKLMYIGSFECELVKSISEDEYIAKGADMAASQAQAAMKPKVNLMAGKKSIFSTSKAALPSHTEDQAAQQGEQAGKNFVIDPSRNGAYLLTDADAPILVATDPVVGLHLKPHQVEGVRFLYRSVMRANSAGAINGCILADEMGLGKTLQSITLIWTLLKQSPVSLSVPASKKAVVVCPSSLVSNWANEFKKWLGDQRVPTQSVMGGQGAKEAVQDFVSGNIKRVLIISYDMLRRHIQALATSPDIGLLVCDEGQRLKNIDGNKTIDALNALPCSRRVLLSGTPIQNDLDEFYAMFSWVCPGLLGNPRQFRLIFADSIIKSRDKGSSSDLKRVGRKRLKELNRRTSAFILRRTTRSVADSLPAKFENLVFCRPSELQRNIYKALLGGAQARKAIEGGNGTVVLSLISKLAKVLNHPDLVRDQGEREGGGTEQDDDAALTVARSLFPADYQPLDPAQSGKMLMVMELLTQIRTTTTDRVVVVSNYTTTLSVLEKLCGAAQFPCLRLDGATEVSKRAGIVQTFNNMQNDSFVFLLSSKAGGCGLNLIGSNRMILVDPSWNPAHDAQAMGRVWRFGQTKTCFIYRMLTTGTMEERILQKQIRKGELESLVVDDGEDGTCRHFDKSEIKNIFILRLETECDTYELLSTSPEFERTERAGVPVVASFACHGNLQQLPQGLSEDDPPLYQSLAKHLHTASFLMSKKQSPEDAAAVSQHVKRSGGEDESGPESDSDSSSPQSARASDPPGSARSEEKANSASFSLDATMDSDEDDFQAQSTTDSSFQSFDKGRPSKGRQLETQQGPALIQDDSSARKRRRLVAADSESDIDG